MAYEVAKREAVPLMIALSGPSGSGKTYSALTIAAGIAGPQGKVGFIDTEAGRGSMYADDADITSIMPDKKYYIQKMNEPFTPAKYSNYIREAIAEKISVLVIDSASHEWEGFGGCQDIAENNKLRGMPNWAKAKLEHKKLMNSLTQCPMHIIFCLRAREKTKPITNAEGKIEMVQMGMQPIQEKNFMFEMTLAMLLEETAPGKPIITKCPKPLRSLFTGDQAILSKEVGEKLKKWAEGGETVDMKLRNVMRECRAAAMQGSVKLDDFFRCMDPSEKSLLAKLTSKEFQEEVRSLATEADNVMVLSDDYEDEDKPVKLFNN